jgi:hypothetical protein
MPISERWRLRNTAGDIISAEFAVLAHPLIISSYPKLRKAVDFNTPAPSMTRSNIGQYKAGLNGLQSRQTVSIPSSQTTPDNHFPIKGVLYEIPDWLMSAETAGSSW